MFKRKKQNQTNEKKKLGMKWFHFHYKIRCPLSVFSIISGFSYFTQLGTATPIEKALYLTFSFLSFFIPVFAITAAFDYHENKHTGYYPKNLYTDTMIMLGCETVFAICSLNPFIVLFYILNFIYFKKRKGLFLFNDKKDLEINTEELSDYENK